MFKYIKAVLITLLFSSSVNTFAEEIPESPKQKEARIEQDVNALFKAVIVAAAKDLNDDQQMRPFALVKKLDGKTGLYQSDESDKNKHLTVVQQASAIRNMLTGLASTNQIIAYAQGMFANVKTKEGQSVQGLSVEIEHKDGVSLMRFIPIASITVDGEQKLDFQLQNVSTAVKPKVVFAQSGI